MLVNDILFTKWEGVSAMKETVVRAFRKCGISVNIDRSEDNEINIKDLDEELRPILKMKRWRKI